MADFNTQGGYFSPKGWMEVNAGGSHEENPNGGVQIGVDEQGIPNMLEEGEPVYDDYVYSDNIKADAKILKKMNLPEKLGGKLYSEIAEELCKEAEERPLDPISNNGLREMLGRLADSQEEQKARTERRKLRQQLNSLSPEELMQIQADMQGGQDMMGQPEAPIAGMQEMPTQEIQQPGMPMANGGNLIRKFDGGSPGKLSTESLNRINNKLVQLNALASRIISGNSRSYDAMTELFRNAAGSISMDDLSDDERKLVMDRLGDIASDAIKGNSSLKGNRFRYFDQDGNYVQNRNYDNMVRKERRNVSYESHEREGFNSADYRDTLGPTYFERRRIANDISDATNGYLRPIDVMRYFSSKAQDVVPGTGSFAYDKRYPEANMEFFEDLMQQHPNTRDAITSYLSGTMLQQVLDGAATDLNFTDEPVGPVQQNASSIDVLTAAGRNAPNPTQRNTGSGVPTGQLAGRTTVPPSNTRLVPVPEFPLDNNTIADEALNTANTALEGSVVRDINPAGNTPLSLNTPISLNQASTDIGLAPRRAPANTTAGSSSDDTGIRTPMLPTFPRYAGALTSAALGLYNMAQTPDRYNIPMMTPNLVSGEMPIQLERYQPIDVNIPINAIRSQGNATNRAIANAGLGPSTGANLIANNAATNNAIGTGFLQAYQANNQQRNNVIAANNNALAQQAQFNMRRNAMNANILNQTAAHNLRNSLLQQRLNYASEGEKYAAIQNQLDQVARALSGIGRENMAYNQINGDDAYDYFAATNGDTLYRGRGRKCGGKIKTKKK